MKLGNPVVNFIPKKYPDGDVTQWFGENKPLYAKICPTPTTCITGGHNGIDIVRPWATLILAVQGGVVCETKDSPDGFGKHVRILTEDSEWTYGHLSSFDVKLGQEVVAGQVIGRMGNTGFVVSGATPYWQYNPYAGTHLHLGRRMVTRPQQSLDTYNIQYTSGHRAFILNYDNGSLGCVPITAEDFENTQESAVPTQTLEMTLQSLENNAIQAEKEGKPAMAAIIRAIKGVVTAFWQ